MSELQIILLVCAGAFIGALYWWGKKNNAQTSEDGLLDKSDLPSKAEPTDDGFEVVVPSKRAVVSGATLTSISTIREKPTVPPTTVAPTAKPTIEPIMSQDHVALASRMSQFDMAADMSPLEANRMPEGQMPIVDRAASQQEAYQQQAQTMMQSQIFALLVLSPSRELTRRHIHSAMEISRLSFHDDGTYVHRDEFGNIIFRIANVVEPGTFPSVNDEYFVTTGVALVLELPTFVSPYRAMDEFITVARKVSQNLSGKLYDAQRHVIKESDLKAMREYAQSLTY
jgi:FtsZ-interacting cell division protein ZipA